MLQNKMALNLVAAETSKRTITIDHLLRIGKAKAMLNIEMCDRCTVNYCKFGIAYSCLNIMCVCVLVKMAAKTPVTDSVGTYLVQLPRIGKMRGQSYNCVL